MNTYPVGPFTTNREEPINAAYSWGGSALAVETIEQLTGVRIDHVVTTNFEKFIGLVDMVGGITVDNPVASSGRDTMTGVYYVWPKGHVQLDGTSALAFSRQRYGLPNGDLDRALRQRALLKALALKIASPEVLANRAKLNSLIGSVAQYLTVDDAMTNDFIVKLAASMRISGGDQIHMLQAPITGFGTSSDGQSIDIVDTAGVTALGQALQTDTMEEYVAAHPKSSSDMRMREDTHSPEPIGRVWVSAEVREELEEILWLLGKSGRRFSEILVDAPRAVVDTMAGFDTSFVPGPVSLRPYSHSTRSGITAKLRSLGSFSWRVLMARPVLIFSGFSMMKHRVVGWALRIPHVEYLRGVVFDSGLSSGISDRLRFGRLGGVIPRRIVMTYGADHVFTVGRINKDFLEQRGLPAAVVDVTGPVWLDPALVPESGDQADDDSGTAYFVTTAWEAHGHTDEHLSQLEITRSLGASWGGPERLGFRIHPRDRHPYEDDEAFRGTLIDRSAPMVFLAGLGPRDLLITPLSTLAFEALRLRKRVVFYSDQSATAAYNHVYEGLGIIPTTIDAVLAGDHKHVAELPAGVFDEIDYAPVRDFFRTLD